MLIYKKERQRTNKLIYFMLYRRKFHTTPLSSDLGKFSDFLKKEVAFCVALAELWLGLGLTVPQALCAHLRHGLFLDRK